MGTTPEPGAPRSAVVRQGCNACCREAVLIASKALTNYGRVETRVEDTAWQAFFSGNLTNEPAGSISVNSGGLSMPSPSTSGFGAAYSFSVINDGSLTIAAHASLTLEGGIGGSGALRNDGKITNLGSIRAVSQGGPFMRAQSGGYVRGGPVVLQDSGALLADSAGTGHFLFNLAGGAIIGRIPAGQTVTVQGEPYSYQGEGFNGTAVALSNPHSNASPVVNNGTLVLDSPGSFKSSGGPASIVSGTLDNFGKLVAQVEDPSWANVLQVALVNEHAGKVDLESGSLHEDATVTTTNDGTVTIAPGAQWDLDEGGGSFVNKDDGTVSTDIASPTKVGTFDLTSPCCAAAGKITADGTLAPMLGAGYVPAANTEFQLFLLNGGQFAGTFTTVGNGFGADYSHESSNPAYVGAVYHAKKD